MEQIDFAVAWEWEYDKDFIEIISAECRNDSLKFIAVHPKNFHELSHKITSKNLAIHALLDRAGDALDHFALFNKELSQNGVWVLNRMEDVERSRDKATMHLEFLTKGIYVPFSVILSPYDKDPELRISELEKLGRPFIIKPACGGGGLGVVMGAENLLDIIEARKEFRKDKYLLQKKIIPKTLGNKRAWFRSYFVCGKVISCWWDDLTHLYDIITPEQRDLFKLSKLSQITKSIAEVCGLNFFSTEIAVDTESEKFIVVDYVNEPCDMRIKSIHADGIPDVVVYEVVQALMSGVKKKLHDLQKRGLS